MSDRTLDAEVVVVGAGPGGCVLSYLLARSGVDTVLVERHADLDREFRGYLFQPLVLRLFDEMGLLDDVLALDHVEVRRPEVTVFGRSYEVADFGAFSERYPYAVLMEQPALLRLLVDRADEYANFEFRPATAARDLHREGDRVAGATVHDRASDEEATVRSRLVVGADGRYSTVRAAAGIDPGRLPSDVELVWFKLPADAGRASAQGTVDAAGVLLSFGVGGGETQVGWFVEAGSYPDLRERGVEAFRRDLAAVEPSLAPALREQLSGFEDCTLLRIEPGMSDRWTGDGLLLLGDAAHVASPIGGQGNGLAVQDAVVAHSVVVDALADGDGPLPAAALREYESVRRPQVKRVLRAQRRAETALSTFVRHGDRVPDWVLGRSLRAAFAAFAGTPIARRTVRLFAWGPEPVTVDAAAFAD